MRESSGSLPKLGDLRARLRSGSLERELEDRPDAGGLRQYKIGKDGTDAILLFGKHRGHTVKWVWKTEPDYLDWILGADFNRDLKDVVRFVKQQSKREADAMAMAAAAKELEEKLGDGSKMMIDSIGKAAAKTGEAMSKFKDEFMKATLTDAEMSDLFETPAKATPDGRYPKKKPPRIGGSTGFKPKGRHR